MTPTAPYEPAALEAALGPPASWPERIEARVLAIMSLLRQRLRVGPEDATFLGTCFVFPNLVRWVQALRQARQATSYASECPVHGGAQDCQPVPLHVAGASEQQTHDLCRSQQASQPWRLQVNLLWNSYLRAARCWQRTRPSHGCASEVFAQIVDNASVRARWPAAAPARSQEVRRQWQRLVDALDEVLRWVPESDWPTMPARLAEKAPAELGALCRLTAEALADWVKRQRTQDPLSPEARAKLERVLQGVLRPIVLHLRRRWTLKLGRYRAQVREFLAFLKGLPLGDLGQVEALLGEVEINPLGQRAVMEFIRDVVLPCTRRGLPEGDPLADPLVQDLFWERVGAGFDLAGWAREAWEPAGTPEVPRWRTVT
jgi:hypothetical protein